MIISDLQTLQTNTKQLKEQGKTIVWTNGCFDIIHPGHVKTFQQAKEMGDILIVWLNGDKSPYRATKPGRPINSQDSRAIMLDSLKYVDYVFIYDEETPIEPITVVIPDVLLKGSDYEDITKIVWYDIVTSNGGKVLTVPLEPGYSTTSIVDKILKAYS